MSFEDLQAVDFDYDDETFTMISNSGQTRTYNIADEPALIRDILEANRRGELYIYEVEEITTSGQKFSEFEQEIRQEYQEKFGDDFDEWKW
jgi:hypothetical protein